MKVGMIFECGPGGADEKVFEYLAKKLDSGIMIIPSTLDSKRKLIEQCAAQAKALLEIEECERVIIVWDLQPRWQEAGRILCIVEECNLIKDSLDKTGLTARQKQHVHLVCIEQELETLLLADKQAVETYLSSIKKQPCRIGRLRNPEHHPNPKGRLSQIFVGHIGRKYNDLIDAERIINLANIDEIWSCSSFVRFADKVAGVRRHIL